jgi:hypothetical protein
MNSANVTDKKAVLSGLLELFQNNRRWLLFFGTGTSCALDRSFGMDALDKHLRQEFAGQPDWKSVEAALMEEKSLERALKTISGEISGEAKSKFRNTIGDFVAKVDRDHRDKLLLHKETWVGSRLLKTLVDRLPPLDPRLSVVTSNYDMLIEYACSALGVRWTTGFARGLVRSWDWEAAQDRLVGSRVGRTAQRSKQYYLPLPRVELFKVHGSINRFSQDGRQVECDLWVKSAPDGIDRDVAVPGSLKFEQAAKNMNTRSYAERAQSEAQAFLIAGYGFEDPHLHDPILARVRSEKCPLVVLTLDLVDATITDLRRDTAPVWILVAPSLISGGHDESKTRVFIPGRSDPVVLDEPLWDCDSFAKRILGG